MSFDQPEPGRDEIVLVLAPTGRDMHLTCALLRERGAMACEPCGNVNDLCREIRRGAGVAVIAEEALDAPNSVNRLIESLAGQLPWSDLPVLVLARAHEMGSVGPLSTLRQKANVTVLDRPVQIVTLLTAVQSALHARR